MFTSIEPGGEQRSRWPNITWPSDLIRENTGVTEADHNIASLIDTIREKLDQEEILISEYTAALLVLSAQAWFEEPPPLGGVLASDQEFLQRRARNILDKTLADPHISRYKGTGKKVRFSDMFYSLAQAGKIALDDTIHKGVLE